MKEQVLDLLRSGKQNAIPRQYISAETGLSDRQVRKAFEQLKHEGYLIAAATDGGYYQIANQEEASDYFAREFAKAKTLFNNLKQLKSNISSKFDINLKFNFLMED